MSIEKQKIGVFELECHENIRKLIVNGVGTIEFDICRLLLTFKPNGCCDVSFNLREGFQLYTKKIFYSEMSKEPRREQVNSVALFQNFLKYSYKIASKDSCFIPKEDKASRIFLCKVFIELLEENNLNISQAYNYTYLLLLELNLELAENESDNDLYYYALVKWLNACQNPKYTVFEEKKWDREEKINKAIFINGKQKFCHMKERLKSLADEDERFKKLLIGLAIEWYLKSRYCIKSARIIFWAVSKKNLFNLLLPRMFSAIIIGYILLVMTEETWELAYRMFNDKWPIFVTAGLSIIISFLYLYIEVSKIGKCVFGRSACIFLIGFLESLATGLIVNIMINRYYTPEKISLDLTKLSFLYYPQVLFLFCPLAMFIGIFVQIIWEDKPITHPL